MAIGSKSRKPVKAPKPGKPKVKKKSAASAFAKKKPAKKSAAKKKPAQSKGQSGTEKKFNSLMEKADAAVASGDFQKSKKYMTQMSSALGTTAGMRLPEKIASKLDRQLDKFENKHNKAAKKADSASKTARTKSAAKKATDKSQARKDRSKKKSDEWGLSKVTAEKEKEITNFYKNDAEMADMLRQDIKDIENIQKAIGNGTPWREVQDMVGDLDTAVRDDMGAALDKFYGASALKEATSHYDKAMEASKAGDHDSAVEHMENLDDVIDDLDAKSFKKADSMIAHVERTVSKAQLEDETGKASEAMKKGDLKTANKHLKKAEEAHGRMYDMNKSGGGPEYKKFASKIDKFNDEYIAADDAQRAEKSQRKSGAKKKAAPRKKMNKAANKGRAKRGMPTGKKPTVSPAKKVAAAKKMMAKKMAGGDAEMRPTLKHGGVRPFHSNRNVQTSKSGAKYYETASGRKVYLKR